MERTRGFEAISKEFDKDNKLSIKMPVRATKNSAGYDFFAAEDVVVPSIWSKVFKRLFIKFAPDSNNSFMAYLKRISAASSDEAIEKRDKISDEFKPTLCRTGIKAYMLEDEVLMLHNRSGNPKKGLVLANGVGVVDSDYYENSGNDGDIMFAFYNLFPFAVHVHAGDKLGQGVFQKFLKSDSDKADGIRTGGFGSTDHE